MAGRICGSYNVRLDDGTCWTVDRELDGVDSLEWILRYGSSLRILKHRYIIASIVASYMALINATQKRRNEVVRELRDALKESGSR